MLENANHLPQVGLILMAALVLWMFGKGFKIIFKIFITTLVFGALLWLVPTFREFLQGLF